MPKKTIIILMGLLFALAYLPAQEKKDEAAVTALVGGTLIDGTGAAPLPNATILIEGERIKETGPAGKVKIPKNARRIDVSKKWVLPGFIDLHTHFTYGPLAEQDSLFPDCLATLRALCFMDMYLRSGVTTTRDVGGRVEPLNALASASAQGFVDTIRTFGCGDLITVTGGHGSGLRSSKEFDGPWEWRKAVRLAFRDGFRHIKLSPTYTMEEVRAAADEARILGMRTTVHGGGLSDTTPTSMTRLAVQAGIQCIEHVNEMEDDVLDLMAEKGVHLVPTLSVYREQYRRNEIPPSLIEERGWTLAMHETLFKKAKARGITLGIGTDVIFHYSGMYPKVYFEEMQYFVDLGMSRMEAIVCATRSGAIVLGVEKLLGTVESGKLADLQVITGDPLVSFDALGQPEIVIVGGRIHDHKKAS